MDALYAPLAKIVSGQKLVGLSAKEESVISRVANMPLLSETGIAGTSFTQVVPRPDPFSL